MSEVVIRAPLVGLPGAGDGAPVADSAVGQASRRGTSDQARWRRLVARRWRPDPSRAPDHGEARSALVRVSGWFMSPPG